MQGILTTPDFFADFIASFSSSTIELPHFPARLEEIIKKSKTSLCSLERSAFAAVIAAIHRIICGFQ